ncbi:MAG: DUF3618 domain-containing protein [Propionibacteriaceae bacterium]|jgi:uncharacterized protein YjbJ (UPF0337 family)|nr:DUF3618 domain-containing protein [Propionibacteriaceae bacterium]
MAQDDKAAHAKAERTIGDIERELADARSRLAENVSSLINEVHPKAVVHRSVEDAKDMAKTKFDDLKAQFRDEDGWRVDRLAALGGAVVGGITVVATVFGLANRHSD